ncbi:hypothetical protein [Roseateles sp.]|uniref:hypothetical protein n=1 Tax=Roseateles sp. TaxID=1971397 RepID=UPI002F3F1430
MIDLLQHGAPPVPPIVAPSADAPGTIELRKFDPTVLDYKIKRAGTFGGLSIAGVLYLVGVLVILKLMGIWPFNCTPVAEVTSTLSRVVECTNAAIGEGAWHGIAGVMLALFSVPTVLLIAILRTASSKKEPLPDTVFTTVADKFATALERVFEPRK